jgi:hypothetical protein
MRSVVFSCQDPDREKVAARQHGFARKPATVALKSDPQRRRRSSPTPNRGPTWPLVGCRLNLEAKVQINDPAVIVAAEGRSVVVLWHRPIIVPMLAVISALLISAVLMPTVVPAAVRTLVSAVALMTAAVVAAVVPMVTVP